MAYLSYFAYQLFVRRNQSVSQLEFQEIHEGYRQRYDVQRSFSSMRDQLVQQGILEAPGSGYHFRYPYIYYYFVASYFRDHVHEAEVRSHISDLSRNLHNEEYGNILLFLAHLSRDPFIVSEMVTAAQEYFTSEPLAALDEDVEFLDQLALKGLDIRYLERDPADVRAKMLEAEDTAEVELDERKEPSSDLSTGPTTPPDEIVQFNSAMKSLQILGQILKNFPGSLEGAAKVQIARECYGLGLRSLSMVLDLVRSNEEGVLELIMASLRDQHPGFTEPEADAS